MSTLFGWIKVFKNLIKLFFNCTIINLFSIIEITVIVVSFLMVIDYFSSKPSLYVSVKLEKGYRTDYLKSFYDQNELEIPTGLPIDGLYRNTFSIKTGPITDILLFLPDKQLVKNVANDSSFNTNIIEDRTKLLEDQICKEEYQYKFPVATVSVGLINEEEFEDIRLLVKSKLSNREYYIFLTALLQSREVRNEIIIKNNGDGNLKNIKIKIPKPFSQVKQSRQGNTITYQDIKDPNFGSVEVKSEFINLSLQSMKQGAKPFTYKLVTRENPVNEREITYSYETEKFLKVYKISYYFLFFFIIFSIVNCLSNFWRKKTP